MLRKLWLSSLLLALTGTTIGLAYSETPITNEIQKPKDRFLTVNEKGKPSIKCKLILLWTNKTGQQCYLVEALETGRKITIVQNPASSKKQNSTTNYHWANAITPPASSPIPPEYNIVKSTPSHKEPVKVEGKTAVNNSTVVPMQTAIQKNNPPLKIETATIKKEVDTPSGKPLATEFITIPAPGADKIVVVPEKSKKFFAAKTPQSNTDKIIVLKEEKNLIATSTGPEKVISITELPNKTPLLAKPNNKTATSSSSSTQIIAPPDASSVANKSESKVAEPLPPKTVNKTPTAITSLPNETKKLELEQPKAQDWRKSWGRMDSSQEKTNIIKPQPADAKLPHADRTPTEHDGDSCNDKPVEHEPPNADRTPTEHNGDSCNDKPVEHEPPHADRTKPDPLKSAEYMHPKLEEKIAKKAVKAVGRESSNQEVESIVSGGIEAKTTAELAEKSTPKTTPTETLKVMPKEKPNAIPFAKVNSSTKTETETVETTAPLPIIVIKEPRQPRIFLSIKKEPIETKIPDFLGRAMGRIYGFLNKPKEINEYEEKFTLGNGSVIAAGAPPVQMIPYQPNGQPLGAPLTAHMCTPPQAPQLFPSNPSNVSVGSRYPTQGMANAFTPVPNQRPIPSDVESTIVMQNAFNPPMPKEGEMPAQGLIQPVNPNTIIAQSVGYGQMPANMMAYIQPQYTAAPVDMVLTENVQTLKNANQPSQREYAADQLSKIRGVSMNQAVIALATAIKEDPAPLVRAACIRSLTRMKINTIEVLEVINEKKTDLDPRVRMEADQALIQLTSGSSESGNRIHQTGSNYKK